jgi:hypothetical protein
MCYLSLTETSLCGTHLCNGFLRAHLYQNSSAFSITFVLLIYMTFQIVQDVCVKVCESTRKF